MVEYQDPGWLSTMTLLHHSPHDDLYHSGYQYCIKSSKILCNSDVSSYLPVSGDELQKQVQASRCHIHTHTHTKKTPVHMCITNNILQQNTQKSHNIK